MNILISIFPCKASVSVDTGLAFPRGLVGLGWSRHWLGRCAFLVASVSTGLITPTHPVPGLRGAEFTAPGLRLLPTPNTCHITASFPKDENR